MKENKFVNVALHPSKGDKTNQDLTSKNDTPTARKVISSANNLIGIISNVNLTVADQIIGIRAIDILELGAIDILEIRRIDAIILETMKMQEANEYQECMPRIVLK